MVIRLVHPQIQQRMQILLLSGLIPNMKLQVLDFPGGKVTFTSKMQFIPESSEKRVLCYRVLDDYGQPTEYDFSAQVPSTL